MGCASDTLKRASLLAALAALVASLLLLAGPAAPRAEASFACKAWGDVPAYKLRTNQARRAVRCLVNKERQRYGVGRLDRDRKLQKASQRHNRVMLDKRCFSHQCPGEASLETRLRSVDYLRGGLSRWAYGENIGYGERSLSTPSAMVRAWMKSPGHRANILNPLFQEIGVGVSDGTPASPNASGATFTTDFGLAKG